MQLTNTKHTATHHPRQATCHPTPCRGRDIRRASITAEEVRALYASIEADHEAWVADGAPGHDEGGA